MTYRQIFEAFPEPYRSQAIDNFHTFGSNVHMIDDAVHIGWKHKSDSQNALSISFIWKNSPEGFEYWFNFFQQLATNP